MKVCPKCETNKPNSAFHRNKAKANGLSSYCKECNGLRQKVWKKKNPKNVGDNQRRYTLRKAFGITPEKYEELLQGQNCCCAICLRHYSEFKKRLAVDHCHKTGAIRGLLCIYCNRGLAAYHDKSDYFRRAADYLEQNTGLYVPENQVRPKRRRKKRRPK